VADTSQAERALTEQQVPVVQSTFVDEPGIPYSPPSDDPHEEKVDVDACSCCAIKAATFWCFECEATFCVGCKLEVHTKHAFAGHSCFWPYTPSRRSVFSLCCNCVSDKPASVFCKTCSQPYCGECFGAVHSRGYFKLHTNVEKVTPPSTAEILVENLQFAREEYLAHCMSKQRHSSFSTSELLNTTAPAIKEKYQLANRKTKDEYGSRANANIEMSMRRIAAGERSSNALLQLSSTSNAFLAAYCKKNSINMTVPKPVLEDECYDSSDLNERPFKKPRTSPM